MESGAFKDSGKDLSHLELTARALYNNVGAVIRASAQRTRAAQAPPVHLIVALDSSLSMRSSFQQAKNAVSCLYSAVLASRSFASNTLYVFAADTRKICLDGQNIGVVHSSVLAAETHNGTNFDRVITAISKQVQEQADEGSYFVVFFTDGKDTCGGGRLSGPDKYAKARKMSYQQQDTLLQKLIQTFEDSRATCAIHTLGFTAKHDAPFLSALTRAGTSQGTFTYLQGTDDMLPCMDNIATQLSLCSFAPPLYVLLQDRFQIMYMGGATTTDADQPEFLEGCTFSRSIPVQDELPLHMNGQELLVPLRVLKSSDQAPCIQDTVEYVHFQLRELTHMISTEDLSQQRLQNIQQRDLIPLRDALMAMAEAVGAMNASPQRSELQAQVADAVNALTRFNTCIFVAAVARNLSNHDIAQINSESYSRVSSCQSSRQGRPTMLARGQESASGTALPRPLMEDSARGRSSSPSTLRRLLGQLWGAPAG